MYKNIIYLKGIFIDLLDILDNQNLEKEEIEKELIKT